MLRLKCVSSLFLTAGLFVAMGTVAPSTQAHEGHDDVSGARFELGTYAGEVHSSVDPLFEDQEVQLVIESINNNTVVGYVESVGAGQRFIGKGRMQAKGKFNFKGVYQQPAALRGKAQPKLQLQLNGQLSASGEHVIGTYKIGGVVDGGRVKDDGIFTLEHQHLD